MRISAAIAFLSHCESHKLSPTTCCYLTVHLRWPLTNVAERFSLVQLQGTDLAGGSPHRNSRAFESFTVNLCSHLSFPLSQVFLQVVGVIAVAALVIPWILIPVVPLLVVFLFLRCYFLRTSRDIKRLESTSIYLFFLLGGGRHVHLWQETKADHRNANKPLKNATVISIKAKGGGGLWLGHTQFPQEMGVRDITYNKKNAKWA